MHFLKYRHSACRIASLVGVALLSVCAAAQAVRYHVIPIASPWGKGWVAATDLSDRGWVTALDLVGGAPTRGFVWKDGRSRKMPTLGGTCSFADGINKFGHVAGSACLPGDAVRHAVLWRHHHLLDLGTFGGTGSGAGRVNRKDDVTGVYYLPDGSINGFVWHHRKWTGLGSLGGIQTYPAGLNNSRVITGQSDISNDPDPVFNIPPFHGFVWKRGVLTDFGEIFGSHFNYGNAIDAHGRIVGSADLAGDTAAHAILWDHGVVHDLWTPFVGEVSWALDINNEGQIVGASGQFDPYPEDGPPVNTMMCPCSAILWEKGQVTFLEDLVDEPGWKLFVATHINGRGEITVDGQQNYGPIQTLLLRPIKPDDPSDASTSAATPPEIGNQQTMTPSPNRIRRNNGGKVWMEQ